MAFHFLSRPRHSDQDDALHFFFVRMEQDETRSSELKQPFATSRDLGRTSMPSQNAWLRYVRSHVAYGRKPKLKPPLTLLDDLVVMPAPVRPPIFDRERDTIDAIAGRNDLGIAVFQLHQLFRCIWRLQ